MRLTFIISSLFIQLTLFSQTRPFIKLSGNVYGHVLDSASKSGLNNCNITLISSAGSIRYTITDNSGFYFIDSIPTNQHYELKIERQQYFSEKSKLKIGMLHDTVIDFLLTQIPTLIDWIPEIYFNYNSTTPLDSSIKALSIISKILIDNPKLNVTIIGHKDSLESIDMRQNRTEFVFNALTKFGIDKTRFKIELSDKPNILKFNRYYEDISTGKVNFVELNEKYITHSPIERQSYLRQLNQCVSFEVVDK